MLSDHHTVHQRRLDTYRSLDRELAAAGVPSEQRVTLAFGIGYETAVLRWFDQLPGSMNPELEELEELRLRFKAS